MTEVEVQTEVPATQSEPSPTQSTMSNQPLKLFPMEKFSGVGRTGSREWLFTYESTANAMGWSSASKLALVTNYLEGCPRTWATERPAKDTWEAWTTAFKTEFRVQMSTATAVRKLLSMRYLSMTLPNYLSGVQQLLIHAGPTDWAGQLELLLPTLPKAVQRDMRKHRPTDWQAFTDILEVTAEEFEDRNHRRHADRARPDERHRKRDASQMTSGRSGSPRSCHNCGSTEHLIRDCPHPRKGRGSTSQRRQIDEVVWEDDSDDSEVRETSRQ